MKTVKAPIISVLLLEDRAAVTRSLQVKLKPGHHRLRVADTSPTLADKSLQARIRVGTGTVTDVRPVRRPRSDSEYASQEAQELRQRLKQLDEHVSTLRGKRHAISQNVRGLEVLLTRWLKETAEDVVWGSAKPKTWDKEFAKLSKRQTERAQELAKLQLEILREEERQQDLERQLRNLTTPSDQISANLEIDLEVSEGESLELELEYIVPGACWRPYHTAQWQGENLTFSSQACVWQNTGEDWSEVQLCFSTQRAALGTEPPELDRDLLEMRKKDKTVVLETREESVQVLQVASPKMPGIDDGGEVLRLEAAALATVKSDGRPHRVPLFEFQTEAVSEQVVTAELVASTFLKSRQSNSSSYPLLAGPVDLIKSCGLVGKSSIDYVAKGEEFEVGWGPQPAVSVRRDYKKGKEDSSLLSGWKTREHSVEVHLSNLGADPQKVKVLERVPISELKQVKIQQQIKKTTEKKAHDEHGFVRWSVELAPRERRTLTLAYTVQKKKDVEGDV